MRKFGYVLTNPNALNPRVLGNLRGMMSHFRSRVSLNSGSRVIPFTDLDKNGADDLSCGKQVTVMVEGQDEEAAVAAIQNYFVACL